MENRSAFLLSAASLAIVAFVFGIHARALPKSKPPSTPTPKIEPQKPAESEREKMLKELNRPAASGWEVA